MTMMADDKTLITRILSGETEAFRHLMRRHGGTLLAFIEGVMGNREEAEDVVQESFVIAYRSLRQYDDGKSSFATWLHRIAYHEALNFVRRTSPAFVSIDDTDKNQDIFETPDFLQQKEERILQMEQAIEMLPPQEQALISMFYYDNMSLGDIAYVTDSIPSTVGSRLSRLRKKLYRIIQSL